MRLATVKSTLAIIPSQCSSMLLACNYSHIMLSMIHSSLTANETMIQFK